VASYGNLAASPEIARQTLALKIGEPRSTLRNITATMLSPRVVTDVINGVNVSRVADFMTQKYEGIAPKTWDEVDIAYERKLFASLLTDVILSGMVDRGEFVW
jgi:hypothetical protein